MTASKTSGLAVTPTQPGETILALVGHFLIIAKIKDHDIRVPIFGMGREVASSRHIPVLVIATSNLDDLPRTVLLSPLLDRSTAWERRLMSDAVTIVVVHISRQQDQSLLHVGQEFRLKASADFLQRVNEASHFVGTDPPVQRKPVEPAPSRSARRQAYPASSLLRGDSTSAFVFWVNDIRPAHWGLSPV